MDTIRLGISACLLGQRVRYDDQLKRDPFLCETLGQYVEFVPVCPEVELGMPVPREPIQLEGKPNDPRLVAVHSRADHTARMKAWAAARVEELQRQQLDGYVLKAKSPSCGMERVNVFDRDDRPRKVGVGMFARALSDHFPLLPVEEDGRLWDPGLRETFIERIFVLRRWRAVAQKKRRDRNDLVQFHTEHKLQLLSHGEKQYRQMGPLVAQAKSMSIDTLFGRYEVLLDSAMRLRATVAKQCNVLQHVMGYFKKELSTDEKQELLDLIEGYRAERLPLIVPLTLINHHVHRFNQGYLKKQHYLNPHPLELRLRNHA